MNRCRWQKHFVALSRRWLPVAGVACAGLWATRLWPTRTPDAFGVVYERGLARVAEVAPYLAGRAKVGETRAGSFNGNRMYYRVGSTTDTIKQLFDYYEQLYAARLPADLDARAIRSNAFRMESEEAGLLGVIDLGPNWERDAIQRTMEFARTGNIAKLGQAKIIVAYRRKPAKRTTFLTFWPDAAFNVANLLPRHDGSDAPGRDLDDVPRYPGLRRLATIEERASFASGYVGVYETSRPPDEVASFYQSNMSRHGWKRLGPTTGRFPQALDVRGCLLFFGKNAKECAVVINDPAPHELTQLTILCRWPGQG